MKCLKSVRLSLVLAAVALHATGCTKRVHVGTSGPPGSEAQPQIACAHNPVVLNCNITAAVWDHIQDRHCGGCAPNDKSSFVPAHCVALASAVAFCQSVLANANCNAVVQPNGRYAASATLAVQVGNDKALACGATNTGTVIFSATGADVVTQFPGMP